MSRRYKVGRNIPCPCGSGKKYKNCCSGKVDWAGIIRQGLDRTPYLTVRGRNLLLLEQIATALKLDKLEIPQSLTNYKRAFTANAVREIHEALMNVWPPDMDIENTLSQDRGQGSGLYIGDYTTEYILKGLAKHSIYSDKLIVIDPFIYPSSVRDEFNPILSAERHRAQTLKNVNFWLSLYPWIDAGIVEVIRTPADFNARLMWDSLVRQKKKFEENKELKESLDKSGREFHERHLEKVALHMTILSASNEYLERILKESGLDKEGKHTEDMIRYVEKLRQRDPNFLEPLDLRSTSGQLYTFSTGANYEIAVLTSNLTEAYLITDIYSRWKEIEIDRAQHNAQNRAWAPFAKAIQEVELKCLHDIRLDHAMRLREEGHLEGLRIFLRKVWKEASLSDPYDEANARLLGDELKDQIRRAEEEWKVLGRKFLKWFGMELGASLLAAGPLIQSGNGMFLAAALATTTVVQIGVSERESAGFQTKFPAAFFLQFN